MERPDVLIVGSGMAGSLLAAKLAHGGKRVLILEAGPERVARDLYSSQIWARRQKWAGPPTETLGTDPIGVAFNLGWGTGGAAVHHYAVWLRLHPEDFKLRTRFGRGLDWPISYEDLRPFYDQVQREVGLSGDAKAEVWRPRGLPYPMPPLTVFKQARLIAAGFQKLGLRTAPLPLAITSRPYHGRPACIYDGWCDAGCPIGALANPLFVYLPAAKRAGTRIIHNAFVSRVLTDPAGRRATGVEFFDRQGKKHVQLAKVVILSAFAVQNPRILLNSATERHPNGLANASGLVGRYMMTHSAANVFGLFKEPTENYLGVTGGQLLCQEAYAKNPKKGYLGSSQWLIGNALKPNDLLGICNSRADLFGEALHGFLAQASQHLATMTFVGENLPDPDNRLVLADRRDDNGQRLASLTHRFDPDDLRNFSAGMEQGAAVFKAAGADEQWAGPRVTMHILGGCIMGDNPRESVTDSYGQSHALPNLFVTGSSLFPSSGAVNPTFTVCALAARTARFMLTHWARFA